MPYISLNKLNYDMTYAPLGFEDEFRNRIKEDILNVIKKLDCKSPLETSKTNRNFKICKSNEYVLRTIEKILYEFIYIGEAGDSSTCYEVLFKDPNDPEGNFYASWNMNPRQVDYGLYDFEFEKYKIPRGNHTFRTVIKQKFLHHEKRDDLIIEALR